MNANNDLLQPSLAADQTDTTAIYSAQTGFFTAFFGGPFAAIAIAAVNSVRLRRLRRDLPIYIAGLAVFAAAMWWINTAPVQQYLVEHLGKRSEQVALRAMAIAYFGVFYLLHRRHYRNMELMGIDAPNGWQAGVPCAIAGFVVTVLLAMAVNAV